MVEALQSSIDSVMTQDIKNRPLFDKVWLDKYTKLPKVPEDWVNTFTDMKKY